MVEGSGHMMMFDRPDAIVAAIDEVIAAADRKP
jgi:pimeloyl-ACP methyl ester carboxylesterase